MKKTLIILAVLGFFCSLSLQAKKKEKNKKVDTVYIPFIGNEADSLSYAFGFTVINGLPQYLMQLGVLNDTTAIYTDYELKMKDSTLDKTRLENELKSKIDSVKAANNVNMKKFLEGFRSSFLDNDRNVAYNTGIGIAGQINKIVSNFSNEVFTTKDSFNKDLFVLAFESALWKEPSIISNVDEFVKQNLDKAQEIKKIKEDERLKAEYAERIKEGDEFMASNKIREGVVTTPSGLQYQILTEGHGAVPKSGDVVKVDYQGSLSDGTVFDSSIKRGNFATFGVDQVIKGWNEALLLMPVGSKWRLYIPYYLAYGENDMGTIKPYSNLIFEVELLDIVKPDANHE